MNEISDTSTSFSPSKDLLAGEFLDRRRLLLELLSRRKSVALPDYQDPAVIHNHLREKSKNDPRLQSILSSRIEQLSEIDKLYLLSTSLQSSLLLEITWKKEGLNLVYKAQELQPKDQDFLKVYQQRLQQQVVAGKLSSKEAEEKLSQLRSEWEERNGNPVIGQRTSAEIEAMINEEQQLNQVEQSLQEMNLNDPKESLVKLVQQMVVLAGGDITNQPLDTDYSTFLLVEQHPLWSELKQHFDTFDTIFSSEWRLYKAWAFDKAVKESLGKEGNGFGYLREFFDDDEAIQYSGEEKIQHVLQKIDTLTETKPKKSSLRSLLTKKNIPLRRGRMRELRRQREAIQEKLTQASINMNHDAITRASAELDEFDTAHPNRIFATQQEQQRALQLVKTEYSQRMQDDIYLTDTEKILLWCELVSTHGLEIPREFQDTLNIIKQVENGTDDVVRANKRMKTVNSLRLISSLFPSISETYTSLHHQLFSEEFGFQNKEKADLTASVLEWMATTPQGNETASFIEDVLLYGVKNVPVEMLVSMALEADAYIQDPSDENFKILWEKCLDVYKGTNQDEVWEYGLSLYDEELQPHLKDLQELENPHYKTGKQLLTSALDLYHERMNSMGKTPAQVYWHRHSEYMDLGELLELYRTSPENIDEKSIVPLLRERGKDDLATIYELSNRGFSSYGDVFRLYNALHADQPFETVEELQLYFADYMGLVISEHEDKGDPVPLELLIAYGLEKNDGDMHAAMWDAAIFVKLLTRSYVGTGWIAQGDAQSGILTVKLLEDPFSAGYTAADVAKILEDEKYWNFNQKGHLGTKDLDPSNLAGIDYHLMNIMAMQGEFAESAGIGGLLVNWFESGEFGEHGLEKFSNQVSWLIKNTSDVSDFLDDLPDQKNIGENEQSEPVLAVQLTQENVGKLKSIQNGELWNSLLEGNVVKFQNEEGQEVFAAVSGSFLHPRLQIGASPQSATSPLHSQDLIDQGLTTNIPEVFSFEEVVGFEQEPLRVHQNLTNSELIDLVNLRHHHNGGVISIEGFVDENVAREILPILLEEGETGILKVLKSPDIFQNVVSKEWIQKVAATYPDQFLAYFTDGWDSMQTSSEVLELFKETWPDAWMGKISSQPELFKNALQPSDLSHVLTHQGGPGLLDSYHKGWNEVWTPDELLAALQQELPDNWAQLALSHPEIFKEVLLTDDLPALIENGRVGMVLDSYDKGWNEVWTPEELFSVIKQGNPDTWAGMVIAYPEIFGESIQATDLPTLLANQGGPALLEHYNKGWNEVWTPEELLPALKAAQPNTWADNVAIHPEIFKEVIEPDDLSDLLSTIQGCHMVLKYYDKGWNEVWTPSELLSTYQQEESNIWGGFIVNYPQIFKDIIQPSDLSALMASSGGTNFLDNYTEGWNEVWTPEEVKGVIQTNEPYRWPEIIAGSPAVFKEMIQPTEWSILLSADAVGEFLAFYDKGWNEVWTPEELLPALKEASPDNWGELVVQYPSIFKDAIHPEDLPIILETLVEKDKFFSGYDKGWNEVWTPEELLPALKEASPDNWGELVVQYPSIFKDAIHPEDLPIILRSNNDLSKLLDNYDQGWNEVWTSENLLSALQQQYPDLWGKYVAFYPTIFKEVISPSDLNSLIASDGGSNIMTGYINGWNEVWTPAELLGGLKEAATETWGDSVAQYPELFRDLINPRDLSAILSSGGGMWIVYNFEDGWNEIWTAAELVGGLKESAPETWGGWVVQFPELFKDALQPDDLQSLVRSGATESIAGFYSLGWNEVWTPEELLLTLKEVSPDKWAEEVAFHPDLFKDVIKPEDLPDLMAGGAFYIVEDYDNKWKDTFTPQELLSGLQQGLPETWGELVVTHPWVFKDVINATDLPLLIKSNADYELLMHYKDSWTELWSPHEILSAFQEVLPEKWGNMISGYPEIFKDLIQPGDLKAIMASGGSLEVSYYYDLGWNELWTQGEIYITLKEVEPTTWGYTVANCPSVYKDLIQPSDLAAIVASGGGESILDNYNDWYDYWSVAQVKEAMQKVLNK